MIAFITKYFIFQKDVFCGNKSIKLCTRKCLQQPQRHITVNYGKPQVTAVNKIFVKDKMIKLTSNAKLYTI